MIILMIINIFYQKQKLRIVIKNNSNNHLFSINIDHIVKIKFRTNYQQLQQPMN